MAEPTPEEVAAFLHAYNNATPEQKASINQYVADQQGTTPAAPAPAAPTGTYNTTTGQFAATPDGGFVPTQGSNYGDKYGIVSQTGKFTDSNGIVQWQYAFNTPNGITSVYMPEANAKQYAESLGIPFQPVGPVTGTADPSYLQSQWGYNAGGSGGFGQGNGGAPGSGPGGTSGPGSSSGSGDKDAFATLKGILDRYGLGSLADWAWDQIVQGNTPNQILQSLRDRPEYKQRFAGMDMRRQNGLAPMSEEEYIASESQIADYLQRAGLPKNFYDTPDDFAKLIGSFANVAQVADRVEKGFMQVTQAPKEVRDEFARWFGVQGDAALAAFFLDPDKAEPALEKMAAQARIGGSGLRQGLDVTQGFAGDLADMGLSDQQVLAGMQQAGTLSGLQYQTLDENAAKLAGLTADTVVGGVFGSSGADQKAVKNRLDSRASQFSSQGSALGSVTTGAIGL